MVQQTERVNIVSIWGSNSAVHINGCSSTCTRGDGWLAVNDKQSIMLILFPGAVGREVTARGGYAYA